MGDLIGKKGKDIFIDKSRMEDFVEKWRRHDFSGTVKEDLNWPRIFRAFRLQGIFLVTGGLSDVISEKKKVSREEEEEIISFSSNLLTVLCVEINKRRKVKEKISIFKFAGALEEYAKPVEEGGFSPSNTLQDYVSHSGA